MVALDGNIESHAETGHAVIHPAADRGFVNRDEQRRFPSGNETISPRVIPVRHSETQRQSVPKRKRTQQEAQTIGEFWDSQDDWWW